MSDIKKDKTLHLKKRAFLAAYGQVGNITQAAEIANITRTAHYLWLNEDENYKKEFEAAKEEAADRLEAEARRRAVEGVVEPIVYQGQITKDENGEAVGIRKYSDTLLIVLMKGTRPDKYRDNIKQEIVGKDDGPIKHDHVIEIVKKHDDQTEN